MHQTSRSNPPAMPVPSPTDNNFSVNKIQMKTKEGKATTSRLGPGQGWGKMGRGKEDAKVFSSTQVLFSKISSNDEEDLFYTILPYFMVRSIILSIEVCGSLWPRQLLSQSPTLQWLSGSVTQKPPVCSPFITEELLVMCPHIVYMSSHHFRLVSVYLDSITHGCIVRLHIQIPINYSGLNVGA